MFSASLGRQVLCWAAQLLTPNLCGLSGPLPESGEAGKRHLKVLLFPIGEQCLAAPLLAPQGCGTRRGLGHAGRCDGYPGKIAAGFGFVLCRDWLLRRRGLPGSGWPAVPGRPQRPGLPPGQDPFQREDDVGVISSLSKMLEEEAWVRGLDREPLWLGPRLGRGRAPSSLIPGQRARGWPASSPPNHRPRRNIFG